MLEESSLSKAWSGQERRVLRIAGNFGNNERINQRPMAPIKRKRAESKSDCVHNKKISLDRRPHAPLVSGYVIINLLSHFA